MVDAIYLRNGILFGMGKRGPKPKGKVMIAWSPDFAYAIGLIASDGNLSPDGRHITFTSKDIELANLFRNALNIHVRLGKKAGRKEWEKKYHIVQFSDVLFYQFLLGIGITPNKSKTIGKIKVPPEYFFDFLRGSFDGDGSFYSYWDSRWKSSFMFYTVFVSASRRHIDWIQKELSTRLSVTGHITRDGKKSTCQLKYAKKESLKILEKVYYSGSVLCLSRKKRKIGIAMRVSGNAQVEKLADSLP